MTSSVTSTAAASATLDDEARARIPQAARAHTANGAEAFARFYLEQFNEAWLERRPELIEPYALSDCKTCANFVATTVWLRDNDLRYDGPPTKVGPSAWLPESTSDHVLVQIVNDQEKRRILRADGTVEESLEATSALNEIELRWRPDTWLVTAIRIAK